MGGDRGDGGWLTQSSVGAEGTHREEHVLFVLVYRTGVRHWVRVFDDGHGLSCRE